MSETQKPIPTTSEVKPSPVAYVATDPVIVGGWTSAVGDASAIAAIVADHKRGENQTSIALRYQAGYIAQRVAAKAGKAPTQKDIDLAVTVREMTGHGAKAKEGVARRTEEQEKAVTAARQAWSRILAKAGIATQETRGGANNDGKSETQKAKEAEKATAAEAKAETQKALPTATTPKSGGTYYLQVVATLKGFMEKNPAATTPAMRAAIERFDKDMTAAVADWQKTE